ncbi:hypothetical protein [Pseudomonas sp. RC10]|uniref:hypothetical protein n=1 Tax=Pseudomonas bambusae TaxID=3139142 RepID=UPI003139DA11
MNKHTPGPWSISEPFRESIGLSVYINAQNHDELAAVVWRMGWDFAVGKPTQVCEANAHLIAAAPELLESLSNLVGLAELGAARLDKYKAALDDAKAVIAKARGQS